MAYLKTTMSVGRLIKGHVVSLVEQAAFMCDVDLEINKVSGGLLEVDYTVKATGSNQNIIDFKKKIEHIFAYFE